MMESKPNIIIAKFRLFWGFCPNCNSDAPKKDNCKICRNGEIKSRKQLKHRFKHHDLHYMDEKDKKMVVDCIDWLMQRNNLENTDYK